ncbi:MAG: phosphoribosylanthranilate isomerase [Oscillospiraceae bacterium]|nr:phosphoribosylanthranilate isomerase [Oscillospiraceae bacterium]MBR3535481.1 phosphoribosylanthranilate isomerase [Oscillospiraceae bacterium]MBR6924803.1 phosphoribosylanthranilate isomerase [Oscillospiraceae bacterium]
MSTKIKMCGLSRPEDIAFANEVKPDFIGFVFAEKSSRYITPEKAAELAAKLDKSIVPVGVFVDSDFEEIMHTVNLGAVRIAQLHGNEPEELVKRLQENGVPVIRAFQIKSEADVKKAETSCADHILLDSGKGSGLTFDWSVLKNAKRPYFLAGGLDPQNVSRAVTDLHPYAVDTSSGLETGGVKDRTKMIAFAAAVRNP